jgi:hypothetical protein
MDWVVVLSGSQKAGKYLSNNGIRSGPLVAGVCFGIFISVPLLYEYMTPLFL